MPDMLKVIEPKSDQLNADDLIAGPRTITITGAKVTMPAEQPVSLSFEGDGGKPWKPCKTMSKLLSYAWGPSSQGFIGRSLTLYRDPEVKWGGLKVGGIRVSHMSHIDKDFMIALTETRGVKKPISIRVLKDAPASAATADPAVKWAEAYIAKIVSFKTPAALEAFAAEKAAKLAELAAARPDLHAQVAAALATRRDELSRVAPTFEDDFGLTPQPAADESANFVQAEPEPEVAAASGPTLADKMAAIARGERPEGRDESQMGEAPALDQAKDALDACSTEDAVAAMLDSYRGQLSDEDLTALSTHANNIVAARWPA